MSISDPRNRRMAGHETVLFKNGATTSTVS
jgi:hypothetical protein